MPRKLVSFKSHKRRWRRICVTVRGVEKGGKRSAVGPDSVPKKKKGTKRRASNSPDPSSATARTSPGPLVALLNQIGRSSTVADLREPTQELKARPDRTSILAGSLHNRPPTPADTSPTQIIQATPNLFLCGIRYSLRLLSVEGRNPLVAEPLHLRHLLLL